MLSATTPSTDPSLSSSADGFLRPWWRQPMNNEREWMFFSFLVILTVGYAAFALVSWGVQFHNGLLANALGILAMVILGGCAWPVCG